MPEEFTADDLINETKAPEGTFEIEMPNGRKVVVKHVSGVEDMAEIRKKTEAVKRIKANKVLAPYLPMGEQTAAIVAELTTLVVHPKFTTLQALRFCKESGPTAALLHSQILASMMQRVVSTETEALEEEKND